MKKLPANREASTYNSDNKTHLAQDREVEEISAYLRNDVEVRYQSTLQNDGNIRCVKQFNRVGSVLPTVTGTFDGKINVKSLNEKAR